MHSKGKQGICDLGIGLTASKAIVKSCGRLAPGGGRAVRARIEGGSANRWPNPNRDRNRRVGKQIIHQASGRVVVEEAKATTDYLLTVAWGDQLNPKRGDQSSVSTPG